MKEMDDRELISLYISGNEKAFETLLMRHKSKIYRYIYLKIRDQALAEDIFQEAFIKIIKTLKNGVYNEEGKFLPWAMRISHNLVIDHFRKANKMKMISESSSRSADYTIFSTLSFQDKNVEQQITSDELKNQMVDLIEYLPETQKSIIKQRLFQEMSFKDISEMEDISINTALGRMRYALINLRKLIEKYQLVTDI
jgi:RNA polymerase sigma-70 factor (ECF subfamily)